MEEVKVIKVIYCSIKRKGTGKNNDPIRIVPEIYHLDGTLIMENDSQIKFTESQMIHFAEYCHNSNKFPCEESLKEFLNFINH